MKTLNGFVNKRVLKMTYMIWAFAGDLLAVQGNDISGGT